MNKDKCSHLHITRTRSKDSNKSGMSHRRTENHSKEFYFLYFL